MTGLENIIKQIENDASSNASAIREEAEKAAAEIIRSAEETAAKITAEFCELAKKKTAETAQRAESAAALEGRREVLLKKQEIIRELLGKSKAEIENANSEKYFEFMGKLLENHALPEDGEIIMSKNDKARMVDAFSEAVKAHGLKFSENEREVRHGFVLVYGSIEINCTLDAVFDEHYEELSDMLSGFLFDNAGGV